MKEIRQVGVIGAGLMGSGISQVFAASGLNVKWIDVNREKAEQGLLSIRLKLDKLTTKGKLPEQEKQGIFSRISCKQGPADLSDCLFVVEAVSEDEEIKRSVVREISNNLAPDAVLASNTSSISISRIGEWSGRAGQVVGMHFMNPADKMPLIEVVEGWNSTQESVEIVRQMAKRIGKTPVTVKDSPGFVLNRILIPMINEGIRVLAQGIADAPGIDQIMKLGASHPMGPLSLADMIGLDTVCAIMELLHKDIKDDCYMAHPLLREMVKEGRLGCKTGEGFYKY